MENETERFWKYLSEKENHLKKEDIKEHYKNFQKLWNQQNNFEKVFDNLRKTNKIFFLIDKQWSVLNDTESKKFKSEKNNIFLEKLFSYFKEKNIKAYIGLESADYLRKEIWQMLHTLYIINEKYNIAKKINNQTIVLIKFPKEIFIENSNLKQNNELIFSDNEKTILDKIYYTEYMKGKKIPIVTSFLNLEKINMYLTFYKKYPLVKATLISLLDENSLKKIR